VTLRTPRTAARRGFTLIEVMLASVLAALVLAAVYMLMNVTVTQTQVSRDAVEVEDLSRGLFNKIGTDLSGTLAPLPPKSGGNSAASGGGSAPASSGASASAPAGGTTPASTPASGSGSTGAAAAAPTSTDPSATGAAATDPSATDNSTAAAADYAFQGGVIGDEKKLIIFAGRVPEAFGRYSAEEQQRQVRSDQRQIIYWLGKTGTGGLYRRERPWVTADEVRTAADDDETATDSTLLAEEVTDLQFEYSDGTTWASTWDGTTPGPDGVTPLGPPRAVRVTLTLSVSMSRGEQLTKQIAQVIAVRAAPGTYTPPLLEAATDGGDNAVPSDPSSGGTASGGSQTGANGTGGAGGGATGGSTGGAKATGATGGSTGGAKSTGSTGGSAMPSAGASRAGGGNSMGGGTGAGTGGGRTGGTGGGTGGGGTRGGGR
jgi:prepilin-type N-terminal cleavage/methylation domain-containing protein